MRVYQSFWYLPYARRRNEELKDCGVDEEKDVDPNDADKTIPLLQHTVYLRIGSTRRERYGRYLFVAKRQKSKYAVVSVHTIDEAFLSNRLLGRLNNMNNSPVINLTDFRSFADGDKIFYKTAEHIEKYYNHWKEHTP